MNALSVSNVTKIFVNGLSALLGGGQTYLLHLFNELPEGEIHVAVPHELKDSIPLHPRLIRVPATFAQRSRLHRFLWENFSLPRYLRAQRIDIYYQPSGMLPWRNIAPTRTAIAFRNMLPFAATESSRFPLGLKRLRYWLLRQALSRDFRRAHLVIFVSHFAKQTIDHLLPRRRGRSAVVYHGLDEGFRRPTPRPPTLSGEYVLYVSILNYYKAQVDVVRSWAMVRARRPTPEKLVLLGPANSSYGRKVRAEVKNLCLDGEVIFIGKVSHRDLPGYYQHAKLNVFASSCENCPNILLEQLAAGRAILASNYQPMPEIATSAALYFDPYRPMELCQLILKTIDDPDQLDTMGREARRRSEDFSWAKTRQETWQALLELG